MDSLEKIIEYSKLGNIYNNKILQVVYTLLSKIVESNKKVIILLTSSNSYLMDLLEISGICTYTYSLLDTEYMENKKVSEYFKENKLNNLN